MFTDNSNLVWHNNIWLYSTETCNHMGCNLCVFHIKNTANELVNAVLEKINCGKLGVMLAETKHYMVTFFPKSAKIDKNELIINAKIYYYKEEAIDLFFSKINDNILRLFILEDFYCAGVEYIIEN